MKKMLSCMLAIAALATCSISVNADTCSGKYYDLKEYQSCGMGHILCDVSLTRYYTARNGVVISECHDEHEYHHGAIKGYNVCKFNGVSIASV